MFWRMTGLSTASPVDTILDKENYTLEELLDEDEIIQECKALNSRLITFLRERAQVEQLLRYIVEEAPVADEKKRVLKLPFIACEIFTCEVGIILQTLVEDEELMDLLFFFLKPDRPHSTLLAGYFSKVILCLMVRKTDQLISYVQGHQEIFHQLVDLIGITSMMEVLIRLIGADENMYSSYTDKLQWLDDTRVIDLIVDKFCSSDAPGVLTNIAEVLCAIVRYAPFGLAAKVYSPSFVVRLLQHALEDSRSKSLLVHSLTICIYLLNPKKSAPSSYPSYITQQTHGTMVTATPETVDAMLGSLCDLLKLLNLSTSEVVMPTTYGILKPPLGKHRLKIVEFISVLMTINNEVAEKEVIQQGAIRQVLDLFLEYPYNNFLHHQVENILGSCLDSKSTVLIEHILHDCDIAGKILGAERQPTLQADSSMPTIPEVGRAPPRIGNIGHLSRIANKLIQAAKTNVIIQTHLQENSDWINWHSNVLVKRNAIENINSWTCGRPTLLQDRDSDDDDFRDKEYGVAALASNLSQVFQYDIPDNDIEDAREALEREEEGDYFDDDDAEVLISSLQLGDNDQDCSGALFTDSNWFAYENNRAVEGTSLPSPSPNSDYMASNELFFDKSALNQSPDRSGSPPETPNALPLNGTAVEQNGSENPPATEWVRWSET